MIVVTFFFFLLWFYFAYKRVGLDTYTYFILLFLITTGFSVLMDCKDLYAEFGNPHKSVGFIAPSVYCLLLYCCIHPYKRFSSNQIRIVTGINEKVYNNIVYVYFALFLLMFGASVTKIDQIIATQNLATLRNDFYHGEIENVWSSFNGYTRIIVGILSLWSSSSLLMLLFFMINITQLKRSLFFNLMTLLGSTTPLLLSLFIMDRSSYVHWFLLLGSMLVLFRKQIDHSKSKQLLLIGIPLLSIMIVYVVKLTISRFGSDSGGDTINGLIYYAGQSMIHFCYFFNDLRNDAPFSLVELFPFTYNFILHLPSYFEQCGVVENYCNYGVSTFSTFLGIILSMSGKTILITYVLIYNRVATRITYRQSLNAISFRKLVFFFAISLIVVNGLFGYCYLGYTSILQISTWLIIANIVCRNHQ